VQLADGADGLLERLILAPADDARLQVLLERAHLLLGEILVQ